jgi:hypothetical protein
MYDLCNLLCDVREMRITEHNTVLLRLWATCIPMDMSCDVHGKVSGFMLAVTVYGAALGGVPCRYTAGALYWNICIDAGVLRVRCLALTYWRCIRVNCVCVTSQ